MAEFSKVEKAILRRAVRMTIGKALNEMFEWNMGLTKEEKHWRNEAAGASSTGPFSPYYKATNKLLEKVYKVMEIT